MPYSESSGSDVPSRIKGSKARRQWAHVWNQTYEETNDEGRAFAAANSVYNNRTKKVFSKAAKADVFEDPGSDFDEDAENEIRADLVLWADYAEDGPTFDEDGKYLCGTCVYRVGDDDCSHVVSPINFETGSCRIYVNGDSKEGAPLPQKLTQVESAYTERPKVKGYGCARCMYGGEAKQEDSDGRKGWCSFWGVHVETVACCFKNTGDDDELAPLGDRKVDKATNCNCMFCNE